MARGTPVKQTTARSVPAISSGVAPAASARSTACWYGRLAGIHRDRRAEAHECVGLVLESRRLPIRLARKDRRDQRLVTEGELAKAICVVIHGEG